MQGRVVWAHWLLLGRVRDIPKFVHGGKWTGVWLVPPARNPTMTSPRRVVIRLALFLISPHTPRTKMPFTGSDICKVRAAPFPFILLSAYQSFLFSFGRFCTSSRAPRPARGFSHLDAFSLRLHSLAIFLPPLGVFLERGCNADFVRPPTSNAIPLRV